MLYTKLFLIIFIPLLFLAACKEGERHEVEPVLPLIGEISDSAWKKLSERRIYFGHQSVGFNVIDGLKVLIKENPHIKLNIAETHNPSDFKEPLFAHSKVGHNMDPRSKCEAFAEFLNEGIGDKVDIAFFKFCFVDVTDHTDIDGIFSVYKETLSSLKKSYPDTVFIHVTVPLTTVQKGFKVRIKKVIGKSIGGYDDNMKRNQYNERLRMEYEGKEPIFDLAKIESIYPDGERETFEEDGKIFYAMAPSYTYDGGHLNEIARKKAAEQLLFLLAKLSET